MNVAALERTLESGALKPIYLIYGPEPFFRIEALRLIRATALKSGDTDISEPEPETLSPADLLDDLRTPTLFAPKRLILIDGATQLIAQSADLLAGYAEFPATRATLALVAETVDTRRKAAKRLVERATVVECPTLKARDLTTWCIRRARRYDKIMEGPAAKMLVDLAGANLCQLDGRIQALVSYCKDHPRIAARHVSDLVGGDHAQTVWDLVRAISDRAAPAALRSLNRLLREPKITHTWILGALARETRALWQFKLLADEGNSVEEIRQRIGKPLWLVRKLMQNVERMDAAGLERNDHLLLQADIDCKTNAGPKDWILETLVIRLCGAAERSRSSVHS